MTRFDELVRLQASSPLLVKKLYKFNFCPADYIHPSRRSVFDGGKLDSRVWESTRARAALSRHILDCLGIEDKICFNPSHAEWPLLLMAPAQLNRLQRHIAAVIFNPLIRHSLLHDDVVTWRERLGLDAYKFALNGFCLLPRAVWSHTDYDVSRLEALSYGMIEAAMLSADRPIRLRAVLKLPIISTPPEIEVRFAQKLVNALMSILEPEWRSYSPATQQ